MIKVCNLCEVPKEHTEFYKQKGGVFGVKGECSICYKKKRRTEKYRKRDRIRSKTQKRINYTVENTRKYRINNPEKRNAHKIVSSYFRKHKKEKPTNCCICGIKGRIHLHHSDYEKPREVFPLCVICHSAYHKGRLELKEELLLSF